MKHVRWWLSGHVAALVAVLSILGCAGRSMSIGSEDGSGGTDPSGSGRGGTNVGSGRGGTGFGGAGTGGSDSGGSATGGATSCFDPRTACPPSQTCVSGVCVILLDDPNNYTVASKLSIPTVETAPADLTVCWTDVVTDLACGNVNPETDIDALALIVTTASEEAFAELLSQGELTMSAIDGYLQYETDHRSTCTELSSLSNLGTPVNVADYYAEDANRSYLFMASRGIRPASGAVSMVFVRPVSTSTNTRVELPPGCGLQELSADLAAADPVRVPYDGPFVIHYGNLTRDGLGNSLFHPNLDGLVLSFFAGATLAELEARVLNLDALATESFELTLSGDSTASLYQAISPETGNAFTGFRRAEQAEEGIWLLRLVCSVCGTEIPPVLVVLEPF